MGEKVKNQTTAGLSSLADFFLLFRDSDAEPSPRLMLTLHDVFCPVQTVCFNVINIICFFSVGWGSVNGLKLINYR